MNRPIFRIAAAVSLALVLAAGAVLGADRLPAPALVDDEPTVVEVAPPYDVANITSLLGVRVVLDVLATLVENGKLGKRPDTTRKSDPAVEKAADETGAIGG